MKKFNWRKFKIKVQTVDVNQLSDRTLLINLYGTQFVTFVIGILFIFLQRRSVTDLFEIPSGWMYLAWGAGFAAAVLLVDLAVSRFVPDDVTDDGGVNERIFRNRPFWHIAVISFIVAVCEEVLFRGAVQHWCGPYWTSIIFAAIHVRYLRHWLMTGLVFSISYGLGWIYDYTGTIWTPIAAHFLIDLIMGALIKYRKEG